MAIQSSKSGHKEDGLAILSLIYSEQVFQMRQRKVPYSAATNGE